MTDIVKEAFFDEANSPLRPEDIPTVLRFFEHILDRGLDDAMHEATYSLVEPDTFPAQVELFLNHLISRLEAQEQRQDKGEEDND